MGMLDEKDYYRYVRMPFPFIAAIFIRSTVESDESKLTLAHATYPVLFTNYMMRLCKIVSGSVFLQLKE